MLEPSPWLLMEADPGRHEAQGRVLKCIVFNSDITIDVELRALRSALIVSTRTHFWNNNTTTALTWCQAVCLTPIMFRSLVFAIFLSMCFQTNNSSDNDFSWGGGGDVKSLGNEPSVTSRNFHLHQEIVTSPAKTSSETFHRPPCWASELESLEIIHRHPCEGSELESKCL